MIVDNNLSATSSITAVVLYFPNSIFFFIVTKLSCIEFWGEIEEDLKNGFIPDLKGMGIQDVLFLLENSGLKVHFSGKGTIKKQSLKKGKRFKNGSEIILELA